jgi:tetratricopeptide (TPR) repeat protein
MIMDEPSIAESAANAKDLSFLLEPSIYHPLSQLDLPAPFRRPFPPLPLATTPLAQSLSTLDALLAKSDFLCAAHIAGGILSSSSLRPTDTKTIFRLLSIRFSCLELTGGSLLAAQESKALEDLISTFYYYDAPEVPKASEEDAAPPEHIMPFSLRLQALRLQSIGFSDPRRGVSALYDLGVECREHIGHSTTSDEKRIALLYVKIGDIKKAQAVQHAAGDLLPLLAIAKGRYEEAAKYWEAQLDAGTTEDKASLIRQNLAVAYLYAGMIVKARDILHGLVDEGESFESLTVNLATLYELSSDRSKELKLAAATKIAANQRDRGVMTPLTNVAFKL